MKGIIFGALDEKSIAWKTAIKAYEEGARLILTNAPIALRMGTIHDLSKMVGDAPVIGADATSVEDIEIFMWLPVIILTAESILSFIRSG
jgi:enoyl-[acyl-carrier protein] reductase I